MEKLAEVTELCKTAYISLLEMVWSPQRYSSNEGGGQRSEMCNFFSAVMV